MKRCACWFCSLLVFGPDLGSTFSLKVHLPQGTGSHVSCCDRSQAFAALRMGSATRIHQNCKGALTVTPYSRGYSKLDQGLFRPQIGGVVKVKDKEVIRLRRTYIPRS
ncbi:hypothetical protein PM082_023960 [Marasmius tenuissimus]|nr:hypothetical protein PM082_023960 [Marasmius tenuissimus]